jgi:hypothetical protein
MKDWENPVSKPKQTQAHPIVARSTAKPAHRAAIGVKAKQGLGKVEVTFGHVSVFVTSPTDAAVKQGVKASAKVIRGLGRRIVTPGVTIRHGADVPLFTADPGDPQRVVRQLNGKSEKGRFINGKFKAETVPV